MKKIILIGAGGHAKSTIEIINKLNKFIIIGLIDKKKIGSFYDFRILGDDKYLEKINKKKDLYFLVTVGQIKDNTVRSDIFSNLKKKKFKIATIIAKDAIVSNKSQINEGTVIFNNVVINGSSSIGSNTIINTSAIIEHDVKIGNNTHISTGVIINGDVTVGSNTFIGSGTIIKNGVRIGDNCFIGLGSIIKKDIKSGKVIK